MTDTEFANKMIKREKREFAIAELKKIKEKIDIECDSVDSALDIILDRISELKGENKQTDVSVNPYDMKYIRCGKGEKE